MKCDGLINYIKKYVFIAEATVLDKHNGTHVKLVENMNDALYEIWEYSKVGNVVAHDFMHSKLRDDLVQFELDFQNSDIPELNARATYKAYKAIMTEVRLLLRNLRNKNCIKPLGIKQCF